MSVMCGSVMRGGVMSGGIMRGQRGKPAVVVPPWLINFKASNTANAKLAIRNVLNGLQSETIDCVGDSTTAGWGSNTTPSNNLQSASRRVLGWPAILASTLAARYGIKTNIDNFFGSTALLKAQYPTYDPRVTLNGTAGFSGTAFSVGGFIYFTTDNTSTIVFAPGNPFDTFVLYCYDTGTNVTLTADTGETKTFVSTDSSMAVRIGSFSFTTNPTSITIKAVNASGIRMMGAQTYLSTQKQLFVQNMGWGNSLSAQWADTTNLFCPINAVKAVNPRLIILELDINDVNTGVSGATRTTNMTKIINAWKDADTDVFLATSHWSEALEEGATGHATIAAMQANYTVTRAIGAALDLPVIDKALALISWTNQQALGLNFDVSHFNTAGYALEGGSQAAGGFYDTAIAVALAA